MPLFEPFESITPVDTSNIDGICKDGDKMKSLSDCVAETKGSDFLPVNKDKHINASYAITTLIPLIKEQKAIIADLENQIQTFEDSVKQQEEPETTLTLKAQTTGPLAIPRPLKPIGVAILFGIAFIFFFTSLAFVAASLPTGSSSFAAANLFTLSIVKNIAIGILVAAVLIMGLALGKVI